VTTADLLLHPVRLRILQAFLGDRELTTSQLQDELSDIPPGSLYRHVARLVDAGVLSIVSERRVRGAVERTYVLHSSAATVSADELANMTPDQHRQMFLAYVAGLIGDFDRYLDRGNIDLLRDGVSYRLQGMWLNDGELEELTLELIAVLRPRLENAPDRGRKQWILGTVVMPGQES
jgi:DNA-binding transcriptional ArsR family regulator